MTATKKGKFVTIEGIEGVGKSSNMAAIEEVLTIHGINFISTREPGGTELSESIRKLLLDHKDTSMTPTAELLLMFAARVQHVEALVKPALAAGTWVICDRFTDSTYAYQGGGRKIDPARIEQLERFCLGDFTPDLTIVLDVPVELGMSRARERSDQDRFEREDVAFFERTRQVFLDRSKLHDRYHVVDAGSELADVNEEVAAIIEAEIKTASEN